MAHHDPAQESALFEKGILAAALGDSEVASAVAEIIEPSDFLEPRHAIIFSKILEFYRNGKVFDVLEMVESITQEGNLDMVGGVPYFMEILDPEAIYANADPITYALTVKSHAEQRELYIIGEKIKESSRPGSGKTPEDTVAYMNSEVRKFSESSFGSGLVRISEAADEAFERLEDIFLNGVVEESGVPTGFIDLDDHLGGLFPGQMIIVAGRPAMGKTTFALDLARNACFLSDKSVAFFSLEMGRAELMQKIIAAEAHVKHQKIRLGAGLTDDEWQRIQDSRRKFHNSKFFIDDNPQLDLVSLQAKCQKLMAQPEGLDMVVIDYLQLMKAPPGKSSREQEVAEISRSIKLLAKEMGIPIIILAQLNRGSTARGDKRPEASDLRESGSLEQDADTVLLVHRPEEYDPNEKPGITEIVIGKARASSRSIVDVMSLLEYSKFGNAAGRFAASEPPLDEDAPPPPFEDEGPTGDFEVPTPPSDEPHERYEEPATAGLSEAGGGGDAW